MGASVRGTAPPGGLERAVDGPHRHDPGLPMAPDTADPQRVPGQDIGVLLPRERRRIQATTIVRGIHQGREGPTRSLPQPPIVRPDQGELLAECEVSLPPESGF